MVRLDLLVPHHHCFKTLPNFTRNSFSTPKGSRSVRNARQWMRKLPWSPPNECTGRKVLAARKLTCTDCHPRKKRKNCKAALVLKSNYTFATVDGQMLLLFSSQARMTIPLPATRSSSLTHQKIAHFEELFTWHRRSALKAKTTAQVGRLWLQHHSEGRFIFRCGGSFLKVVSDSSINYFCLYDSLLSHKTIFIWRINLALHVSVVLTVKFFSII